MAGNFSMGRFKKGPPDAVSISLFISPFLCPAMDWNMALCSLSTGRMFTLFFLASSITNPPAITRTSLFARAMSLPALIAARVGIRPDAPTSAETTMSAPSQAATSSRPSSPQQALGVYDSPFFISFISHSSERDITSGRNSSACLTNNSLFLPAAMAVTRNLSGYRLMISRVLRPMEPVEPRIASLFNLPISIP